MKYFKVWNIMARFVSHDFLNQVSSSPDYFDEIFIRNLTLLWQNAFQKSKKKYRRGKIENFAKLAAYFAIENLYYYHN